MADFNDLFNVFGSNKVNASSAPKSEEKAPVWAAKEINGKLYVSLEQVAELLKMNDVLPKVRRGLERRI